MARLPWMLLATLMACPVLAAQKPSVPGKPAPSSGQPGFDYAGVYQLHDVRVSIITNPDWLTKPDPGAALKFYPKAARAQGVNGAAIARCKISRSGQAFDCKVEFEEPAGFGFGDAVIRFMSSTTFRPGTRDGQPIDDRTLAVPMRFTGFANRPSPELPRSPPLPAVVAPPPDGNSGAIGPGQAPPDDLAAVELPLGRLGLMGASEHGRLALIALEGQAWTATGEVEFSVLTPFVRGSGPSYEVRRLRAHCSNGGVQILGAVYFDTSGRWVGWRRGGSTIFAASPEIENAHAADLVCRKTTLPIVNGAIEAGALARDWPSTAAR